MAKEGRPLVTLKDLPEGWQDLMRRIYEGGGSDAQVKVAIAPKGSIAMSNDLWDRLIEDEPIFSEAVKGGRTLSEAHWAEMGQSGCLMGKDFNGTTYIFNMKNRFRWKDKHEVEHSADKNAPPTFTLKIDNS